MGIFKFRKTIYKKEGKDYLIIINEDLKDRVLRDKELLKGALKGLEINALPFAPSNILADVVITIPGEFFDGHKSYVEEMRMACYNGIPELITEIAKLLNEHNEAAMELPDSAYGSSTTPDEIYNLRAADFDLAALLPIGRYRKKCEDEIQSILEEAISDDATRRKYRIGVATKISLGVAVVTSGVVMLATAPVLGPLGLYNTVKASTALITDVVKYMVSVKTFADKLEEDRLIFIDLWEEVSKSTVSTGAFELTLRTFKNTIGSFSTEIIPSISDFAANVKTLSGKIADNKKKVERFTNEVDRYSDQSDLLAKDIQKADIKGEETAGLEEKKKVADMALGHFTKTASDLNAVLNYAKTKCDAFEEILEGLQGDNWPAKTLFFSDVAFAAADIAARASVADFDELKRIISGNTSKLIQHAKALKDAGVKTFT